MGSKRLVITAFAAAMVGVGLTSGIVMADNDSVVDQINITVPVLCTFGGTGMDTHNAIIDNGQYNSAIGETTMEVYCNDNNGFSVYAIGYTDNIDGKNVLTNPTLGSAHDIETGTLVTGAQSQWAMKLSTVTSPVPTYPVIIAGSTDDTKRVQGDLDYSTFQEVPDDYVKVAYRDAGTDIGASAEGATLKTTYQAYISSTQAAGTYTGQVKYTMVHPYNAEAPFMCKPDATTISTIVCMQDISSTNKASILASMVEDQQYTLKDKRDSKTYTVSKLKDGNIWMTQNLDLDLDSNTTYTNEDTDLGWNASTSSYDTASWTPLRSTYSTGTKTWCQGGTWNAQSSSCWGNNTPESYNPGDLYWNGTLASNYGSDWTAYRNGCTWDGTTHEPTCNESLNPIATYTTVSGTPTQEYHLGNYYNWTAAVAMNNSSTYTTNNQDVNQSICPSGWTLPKSGNNTSSGSFQYLFEQYGWSNYSMTNPYVWNSAIKMPLSGHWYGLLDYIGDGSYFWSPMVIYVDGAYAAATNYNGSVVSGDDIDGDRYFGNSVRCLVR